MLGFCCEQSKHLRALVKDPVGEPTTYAEGEYCAFEFLLYQNTVGTDRREGWLVRPDDPTKTIYLQPRPFPEVEEENLHNAVTKTTIEGYLLFHMPEGPNFESDVEDIQPPFFLMLSPGKVEYLSDRKDRIFTLTYVGGEVADVCVLLA